MAGYTKNIAVIKGIRDGFSADGGALSGLVKAEKYGAKLRIEVSFINFAPLSEGRYVCGVSDGKTTQIVENGEFEGASGLNTDSGFAALIAYVNGKVFPVASAICGNFHDAALEIKQEIEREENLKIAASAKKKEEENDVGDYEDEAIAEVNYFEYAKTDKDGGAVREDKKEEKERSKTCDDEKAFGAVPQEKDGVEQAENGVYDGGNAKKGEIPPLSRGGAFYERMKEEIDKLLSTYPAEECLENLIEGSRWVRISYAEGAFYVFGVLYEDGKPRYICYGVPAVQNTAPPESMTELASFLPASPDDGETGYWVMYQDADTGASLKVNAV